jgi:ferric-dicitrate binding protein FerR (iron transport regulator)
MLMCRWTAAPQAIDAAGTPDQRVYKPQPARVDWTYGWLSFDGTPLEEVAASSNRYTTHKILISDPATGALRGTGGYKTGDSAGLVKSLAKTFNLQVIVEPSGDFGLQRSDRSREE